ncbi:hypothetical protein [Catellatospora sp. NPDC049609]|uniref:golvesin C-terminal-like domain-containing protein n=1 Tax=Catellatospora sp. NPDC049609 TaxID=3155505 RepID=UPI003431AAC8
MKLMVRHVGRTLVAVTAWAMVAGMFPGSALAVEDPPPPPNYNACAISGGFWNGIGVMNYRMDADYQYLKFYNCPLPAPWAPQDVYKVSVNYVVNPDNDDSYTTTRLDFCLSPHMVLDLGAGGHHSGSRYRNGAAIMPIALPRKDGSCSPANNPPVPPVGPPGNPPPGSPPPAPPTVHITGTVVAPRRMTIAGQVSPVRPLPGAKWELWYEGKGGAASDPVQWRAVPSEPGEMGVPVTGYLDDQGRFDLNFVYPQRYQLPNGTEWHGCSATSVSFQQSYACADDKLVLKVFPVNQDVSAVVREPGSVEPGDYEPMLTIPLGLHFQRDDGLQHRAESNSAHAYAAIYNVRELVGTDQLGDAHIFLNDEGRSFYDPVFGVIHVGTDEGASGQVEHELGHRVMHQLYGLEFVLWVKENCNPHYVQRASSEECAWSEGFAYWIGVAAENEPGSTEWTQITWGGGYRLDIEKRTDVSGKQFEFGPEVEGNIAAALFDLIDNNPPSEPNAGPLERKFNVHDISVHPFQQVLDVIWENDPRSFTAFWPRWVEFHSGEQRDAQTLWLNTLHFAGMVDADTANGRGAWVSQDCGSCLLNDMAVSKDPAATLTWNVAVKPSTTSHKSGLWDVWVYVPEGNQLDPNARYKIKTNTGSKTFIINQQVRQGNWVLLNPAAGVGLNTKERVAIELARGTKPNSQGTKIQADGVLIAPRLPW